MESILNKAVQSVQGSSIAFSKYITANDVGATGGHQAGFHIHKGAWSLFFDTPGQKGDNRDKYVTIVLTMLTVLLQTNSKPIPIKDCWDGLMQSSIS